jgi:hypothetical protein
MAEVEKKVQIALHLLSGDIIRVRHDAGVEDLYKNFIHQGHNLWVPAFFSNIEKMVFVRTSQIVLAYEL